MKAILFDLFGTLVDNMTVADISIMHGRIATVLHVPASEFEEGWKQTFQTRARGSYGSTAAAIAAAAACCSVPYNASEIDRAVEIRTEIMREWLTPRPDAISTLVALRGREFKTGLLSNCTEDVPMLWPSLPFVDVIEHPLFSCSEGLRKPMLEFYQRAFERMDVAPEDCLYVADGDNGELAAAKSLGMPVIMIRPSWLLNDYRHNPEEDWDGPRIERLSELLDIV